MSNYNESDHADVSFSEPAEPFRQFPFEVLPDLLSAFVKTGSKSIGCDPAFIALPLLSALGSAIGNTRRLVAKSGWTVPPIIWTAIVGESGTQKSPAYRLCMNPILKLQYKLIQEHLSELKKFEIEMEDYSRDLANWKKSKIKGDRPISPIPPVKRRLVVSDTTIEALGPILLNNPRGVLVATDELAGWLGSFDKYSSGSSDSAKWLSMYNADSLIVDRKTGTPPTIFIPSAATSITGGIQPGVLTRLLGQEHRESGLAARLLLCCPPRRPKRWTDDTISDQLLEDYTDQLFYLYGLRSDENGQPVYIRMNRDAQSLYRRFYNDHGRESAELTGDLAAAYSKLEETPLRLSLILHCCQRRDGAVQAETMESAITLTEWFKYETCRVYSVLAENAADRQLRELAEWVRNRGETVTARDVLTGRRNIKTADHAELALQNLVDAGYGDWIESDPGTPGRPTRRFQLVSTVSVCKTPANPSENGNCADADTADDPKPKTKRLAI